MYAQQGRKEDALQAARRVVDLETAASTPCEDMKTRILELGQSAPDGLVSIPASQPLGSVEAGPSTALRHGSELPVDAIEAAGRDRSESPPLVQSDHHVITENGKAPEDKRKKDVSSVEDEGWGICCFDR